MEGKKMLIPFVVFVLLIGGIPVALAGFVPGTGETTKIWLLDAANPAAAPVTYPDGQQYIELNDTYSVGDTFTVWANVTDVTELRLYAAGVTYDDSILECTSYSEGEFFYRADAQYRTAAVNLPMSDDGAGLLGYWNHISWALKKPGNVSGTGTLAVFDFKVVGRGDTLIDIILTGAKWAVLKHPDDTYPDFNTIDIIFDNRGLKVDHELTVSVEAPDALKLGESSLLNATVSNIGLKNETNVELQLLINGTAVNSMTITKLLTGSSYTINHLWAPTTGGMYNVTAYAKPVPDENSTVNNVATKFVPVPYAYLCEDHPFVWDGVTYLVRTCSNAIVSDFDFSQLIDYKNISFSLTAQPGEITVVGWVNVTIPKALLDAPADRWVARVDGDYRHVTTPGNAPIVSWNETHTFVYFNCSVNAQFARTADITGTIVIPEFPADMLLLLFMIATLVVVTLRKINQPKKKTLTSKIGSS